jgi:hypothetical protein
VDERTPEPHRGEEEREVGAAGEARKLAEAGAAYAGQQSPMGRRPGQTTEDRDGSDALEDEIGEPSEGPE